MPRERQTKPLNLMPIVNLATLLVPMGLMVSQFVALQWFQSAPATMPDENLTDARVTPVRPIVRIRDDGFEVLGAEAVLAGPQGRPVLPCPGTCATGGYDQDGLRRLLGHVKAAYPWADELVIERRADVGYDVLVATVATVRGDDDHDLFPRVVLR